MARTKKARLSAEFKHGISIGSNGEFLYDCPIEIKNKADRDNYGISYANCVWSLETTAGVSGVNDS